MKNESSNKSFGLVFFVVLFVVAFWSFRGDFHQIKLLPLSISMIFLILGLLNSKLLTPFNKIWIKFGELLGKVVAPLVMMFIFFIIITPLSLFIKLIGKDLINIKYTNAKTYWIKRHKDLGPMKKQF